MYYLQLMLLAWACILVILSLCYTGDVPITLRYIGNKLGGVEGMGGMGQVYSLSFPRHLIFKIVNQNCQLMRLEIGGYMYSQLFQYH